MIGEPLTKLQETILREARAYVDYDDENRLLIECQHMGVPTNVIDFTRSPVVALWFACRNIQENGRVRFANEKELPGRIIERRDEHNRATAQEALLVYTADGTIPTDRTWVAMEIPAGVKNEIHQKLDEAHSIRRGTLFRDLEGFREEIDSGYTRFIKADVAAGNQAFLRGDYGRAMELFARTMASYRARHPKQNGGYFSISSIRKLAVTQHATGRVEEARQTIAQAMALVRAHHPGRTRWLTDSPIVKTLIVNELINRNDVDTELMEFTEFSGTAKMLKKHGGHYDDSSEGKHWAKLGVLLKKVMRNADAE